MSYDKPASSVIFNTRFPTVMPPFGNHGVTHLRLERRSPYHAGYAGKQTAQGVLESAAHAKTQLEQLTSNALRSEDADCL